MLVNERKPEFQFKRSSKNAKFGQCLYLVARLRYEQNRCAEWTVTPLTLCCYGSTVVLIPATIFLSADTTSSYNRGFIIIIVRSILWD